MLRLSWFPSWLQSNAERGVAVSLWVFCVLLHIRIGRISFRNQLFSDSHGMLLSIAGSWLCLCASLYYPIGRPYSSVRKILEGFHFCCCGEPNDACAIDVTCRRPAQSFKWHQLPICSSSSTRTVAAIEVVCSNNCWLNNKQAVYCHQASCLDSPSYGVVHFLHIRLHTSVPK